MNSRKQRAKKARNMENGFIDGIRGGFLRTRLDQNEKKLTIWIEGSDSDGPSVSGIGLDQKNLEKLIKRLSNSLIELRRSRA